MFNQGNFLWIGPSGSSPSLTNRQPLDVPTDLVVPLSPIRLSVGAASQLYANNHPSECMVCRLVRDSYASSRIGPWAHPVQQFGGSGRESATRGLREKVVKSWVDALSTFPFFSPFLAPLPI